MSFYLLCNYDPVRIFCDPLIDINICLLKSIFKVKTSLQLTLYCLDYFSAFLTIKYVFEDNILKHIAYRKLRGIGSHICNDFWV